MALYKHENLLNHGGDAHRKKVIVGISLMVRNHLGDLKSRHLLIGHVTTYRKDEDVDETHDVMLAAKVSFREICRLDAIK